MTALVQSRAGRQLAIAVPPAEHAYWTSIASHLDGFAVFAAETQASGDLVLTDCGRDDETREPTFFALACVDPANARHLQTLKGEAALAAFWKGTDIVSIDSRKLETVQQRLLQALCAYMGPLCRLASEQALALSATRRDYERLHDRFSTLESYIQRAGVGLMRERAFIEPDMSFTGETVFVEGAGRLRQLLPVSSKGLCALELLTRVRPHAAEIALRAFLFLGDDARPAAAWRLRLPAAIEDTSEWQALRLDRAIDGVPRNVWLEVEIEGGGQGALQFAVARPLANPDYCLHDVEGALVAKRPLALRLWEAPPGLATPRIRDLSLVGSERLAPEGGRRVPGVLLRQVKPYYPPGFEPGFAAVAYQPDSDSILVHPPDSGVCAGLLEQLAPRHSLSVSARVMLAHDESNPVEFALAVLDPARRGGGVWHEFPQFANLVAWSGWRGVRAGNRHQLTVALTPEPDVDKPLLSLVLMTRMADEQANGFAWAWFTDILIEECS